MYAMYRKGNNLWLETVAKQWLADKALTMDSWSFRSHESWKDKKGFLMCTLTQKPSQYYADLIRHAMKTNHNEYIGNRRKSNSKLHNEWKYNNICLNNVNCFLVTKKTTSDLSTTERVFKLQVCVFYRYHSRLSHINIQDMVAQAINLEVESQR